MNTDQQSAWRNEALNAVFAGLASSSTLSARVIYKGARILNHRLGGVERQSLDIDMNLTASFIKEYPDRGIQRGIIETEITSTLQKYFREQPVVRYKLVEARVQFKPKDSHPLGWNAFEARLRLEDMANPTVRGVPHLQLDIAAPELLGAHATAPLDVHGKAVTAYTVQRIAGEKLRAFLTSLPAYRSKIGRPGEAVRAKDLVDIARIVERYPPNVHKNSEFWSDVGTEFRLACQSRFVDCEGMDTFAEHLVIIRQSFLSDSTLQQSSPAFEDVWSALEKVVNVLAEFGLFPLCFDLPKDQPSA